MCAAEVVAGEERVGRGGGGQGDMHGRGERVVGRGGEADGGAGGSEGWVGR